MLSLLIVVSKVMSETPMCFFLKPSFQSALTEISGQVMVDYAVNHLGDFGGTGLPWGCGSLLSSLFGWRLENQT